jgi:hypothetical protein
MRARLVTACTWLTVTAAAITTGCRLEPIPNPGSGAMPPDAAISGRRDAAVIVPPPSGTMPYPTGNDGPSPAPPADAGADLPRDLAPAPDLRAPDTRPPDLGPDVPPADPNAGLVGRWSFDEGMGMSAADTTGNGHNATLHNGVAWERSGVGRNTPTDFAVRLDGSNDYLSMPVDDSYPRLQDAKSISFWFDPAEDAPANPGSNQRTCVALVNPGSMAGIQVGTDRNRLAVWSWGQNQGFVIANAPPGNGTHHVAYTFDGNTHRLYVDGSLIDSATPQPQTGRASILYVGTYDPPNELCAGQIDDLRIYDRALPVRDIAALATRP